MGIFGRIKDLVSANVNDLVDKAENPEKMIKQIIREIEDSIDNSKQEAAKIISNAKRIEKDVDTKAKDVAEWTNRAEIAVDSDDDDLARKALERKLIHEKELNSLQTQLDDTRSAADQIKDNISTMQERLNEARARQTSLAARASAAKASKEVQEKVADLNDPGKALGKLDKFERRVEDMENEASAIAGMNSATDELEKEFAAKEKNSVIDDELAALKAQRKNDN